MKGFRILMVGGAAVLLLSSIAAAQEPSEDLEPVRTSILDRSGDGAYQVVSPRLGQGYVGYQLPAVDSCPCSNDRCFHPCRYYFGGNAYNKSWRRRWLSAQLGHGSMLDAYGGQCLSPGLTRPYWRPLSTQEMNPEPTPTPVDVAQMLEE